MPLSLKPELRTNQSLVMTPQLMQAIKLLQLSSADLAAYVETELEQNPLLERDDESDAADAAAPTGDSDHGKKDDPSSDPSIIGNSDGASSDDPSNTRESVPLEIPNDSWATGVSRSPVRAEDYNLEAFVAQRRSLQDHLSEQLALVAPDATTMIIGAALIAEIDEAGYLREDMAELADRLGASAESIDATLKLLRSFDPTGVFAHDLPDCLSLQLREKNRLDPAMEALVANLHLVARRDYSALLNRCEVDEEDLAEMLAELRALDPKPGADFNPAPTQTVIPDIMVTAALDGGWRVELNNDTLPRLLVNQSYYATVSRATRLATDRAFLSERFQTAKWLVDSLDRRANTILKVASEIVRQQDGFFANGVEHLRPLNLKVVADAIDMHESTVSRVTSNKYLATHRGIFELKYFFTSTISSSSGGEGHSAETVRHRIRGLIDHEEDSVLSDDAIVAKLRELGIAIARRTVAKYREAMRIPSSVDRRRERQAGRLVSGVHGN